MLEMLSLSHFFSLAPEKKEDCNMFFEGDDCKKGELELEHLSEFCKRFPG